MSGQERKERSERKVVAGCIGWIAHLVILALFWRLSMTNLTMASAQHGDLIGLCGVFLPLTTQASSIFSAKPYHSEMAYHSCDSSFAIFHFGMAIPAIFLHRCSKH